MTEADAGVIVIGAGEAGAGVAFALRQNGYVGPITLIGEEGHPPYRRPPLSKGFLTGEVSEQALMFRSSEAYERARIKGRYATRVLGIDRTAQTVVLEDGPALPTVSWCWPPEGEPDAWRSPAPSTPTFITSARLPTSPGCARSSGRASAS